MALTITTDETDDLARVSVEGEVDVSCASDLRAELDQVLADKVASVEVDLSQMSYIDSTGIGVLVGFAHRAQEAGTAFSLLDPQPNVARVLGLLGVSADLNVVSTPTGDTE